MRDYFFVLIAIICIVGASGARAEDRCERLEAQLIAEKPYDYRRWIAAFSDLEYKTLNTIREKGKRKEIPWPDYGQMLQNGSKLFGCLDRDINLKAARLAYERGLKLNSAGCRKGPLHSINGYELNSLREHEKQYEEACTGIDVEALESLRRQVEVVKVEKAAAEEAETPPVRQADTSFRASEFCKQTRSLSAQATTFFKSVTGAKTEKTRFAGSEALGIPSFKFDIDMDIRATPVALTLDFLSVQPGCDIRIGTQANIAIRLPPTYSCVWKYPKITRRDLELRADKLLNAVRGCFDDISELPSQGGRHRFSADKLVDVSGNVYFGDGKPSSIYLEIRKFTPEEDEACTRWLLSNKARDQEICMRKHVR